MAAQKVCIGQVALGLFTDCHSLSLAREAFHGQSRGHLDIPTPSSSETNNRQRKEDLAAVPTQRNMLDSATKCFRVTALAMKHIRLKVNTGIIQGKNQDQINTCETDPLFFRCHIVTFNNIDNTIFY